MLAPDAKPIVVEAVSGRAMTLAPKDIFLATPGYRESTRWVVGGVPRGGLKPNEAYWVLSESGVVGKFVGESPAAKSHLGRAIYLGTVQDEVGGKVNIKRFALPKEETASDSGVPVFVVIGTSAEVGKTTACVAILRTLRKRRIRSLVALKATGTSSITEISTYRDFGAEHSFDCVDFGLPTTYPSERPGIADTFTEALNTCLSLTAEAVIVECGGDLLGANVPVFLQCLKQRRADAKIILVAADALGAFGAKQVLREIGLEIHLIAGPCTDTPTLQKRTERLCSIPAVNVARGDSVKMLF
jgi:hypothetical protein